MNPQDKGRFEVRAATRDEFATAIGWARDEGWNPGIGDLQAFFTADPTGFLMGFADGLPVTSISVVRYGDDYGFLGFYIAHPDYRGRGYGIDTWKAGMDYLAGRTVGLDGVVAQQDNYRKSGFSLAGRNIRYSGVPDLPVSRHQGVKVAEADSGYIDQIEELDRVCFGVPRSRFLREWVFPGPGSGRRTFAAFEEGELTGYATIRKCIEGNKIGPLFSRSLKSAEALFQACCADAGREAIIVLDVPELNPIAMKMAEAAGMKPVFETARMYSGPAPEIHWARVFGVTTFELG